MLRRGQRARGGVDVAERHSNGLGDGVPEWVEVSLAALCKASRVGGMLA